ncbi:MAG: ABC transporter ATP-binding protein [Anaerolineae bacterium]|nr:ABC transporter ATP-binding protein [Anaerolineae bacterium]
MQTSALARRQPVPLRKLEGRTLVRCLGYVRRYWPNALCAYLTLFGVNALNLAVPQLIRRGVDVGIRGGQSEILPQVALTLLGLVVVKGVLTFTQGYLSERVSQGVAYELRNAIHLKLQSLSFSYHDRAESGQLLARAISDVDRIRFLTGRALLRLIDCTVLFLGAAVMLVRMNPTLAFLSLGSMPLLALQAYRYGRVFRPLSTLLQQQLGVLTTRLEQNLRGARIVKAFAQELAECERFERENRELLRLHVTSAAVQARNVPLMDLIASLGTVAIIWYGGRLVIEGQLTLGQLVAFNTYLAQLVLPVRRVGMLISVIAGAVASGQRVFEILDAESEVREKPGAVSLPPLRGQVRFERVSFAYFGRQRVLEDVSFEVQPGQVVALLGATGSGKSTITNLIPRFYDPTLGRVLIDGYDLREVTLASLRRQIGIVLQESTLFAASIRENIAFGRPGAGTAEIVEAARAAQAHEFILQMPEGYDTRVGERGVTLSGGQKQRIAIARALLKDPRILILDEATSSVDTDTELEIQAALERLMVGRTSFVIAQRLSTVRKADLILVLDRGRLVAQGSHEELLHRSGFYADIYYRQLHGTAEARGS